MILTTEGEYQAALAEVAPLFDLGDDGLSDAQSARAAELIDAIEAYETVHYPRNEPSEAAKLEIAAELQRVYGRDLVSV